MTWQNRLQVRGRVHCLATRGRAAHSRACAERHPSLHHTGQQRHDPLPSLPARSSEVDRTDREVPREGSRRASEGEGGLAEEALGPRLGADAVPQGEAGISLR